MAVGTKSNTCARDATNWRGLNDGNMDWDQRRLRRRDVVGVGACALVSSAGA